MFYLKKILINNSRIKIGLLRLYSMQNKHLTEWNNIKSSYSSHQLKLILNTLNKINEVELKNLGLSVETIKMLEFTKNERKKYKSLDDFITLNIIDANELNVCSNLITKRIRQSKKIVTPAIEQKKLKTIKTAIGIRIKDRYISWSQLKLNGSQCSLLKWNCHELVDLSLNSTIPQIIHKVKDISESIPDADVYVMEKDSSKPSSKVNINILRSTVQHQKLLSILLTLLWTKNNLNKAPDSDFFSSLYMIRPYTYAQLFQLYVGNEIVSAVDVVNDLLANSSHKSLKHITFVCFDETIIEQYYSLNQYMKEELGRSLLLTLTFFESVILDV
ncbi:transcription elongation factor, mitochondrial isoform X1 [Phymastichus coffea]|uniref:transcription elongation factor, mitochondrial isoform X1 n=1 Tax=Phymastichus coffea TaxID=108790 RepID=UPI00273B6049|nr:transcription elongation factor, mitochondrial isoform X1 [Phymastichus coffea]